MLSSWWKPLCYQGLFDHKLNHLCALLIPRCGMKWFISACACSLYSPAQAHHDQDTGAREERQHNTDVTDVITFSLGLSGKMFVGWFLPTLKHHLPFLTVEKRFKLDIWKWRRAVAVLRALVLENHKNIRNEGLAWHLSPSAWYS